MNDCRLTRDIVDLYYQAVKGSIEGEYWKVGQFSKMYPIEYKFLSSIHRKRSKINNCIKAINSLGKDIYWGTLTFNNDKDLNLIKTKRREAFLWLNTKMDYFLLVEEFGEDNGRYHLHFIGSLKYEINVEDFMNHWHSREQIRKVNLNKNLSSYMVKYLSKDLPRIRCNKSLVALVKAYKVGLRMDNLGFYNIGVQPRVQGVTVVSVFDLDL